MPELFRYGLYRGWPEQALPRWDIFMRAGVASGDMAQNSLENSAKSMILLHRSVCYFYARECRVGATWPELSPNGALGSADSERIVGQPEVIQPRGRYAVISVGISACSTALVCSSAGPLRKQRSTSVMCPPPGSCADTDWRISSSCSACLELPPLRRRHPRTGPSRSRPGRAVRACFPEKLLGIRHSRKSQGRPLPGHAGVAQDGRNEKNGSNGSDWKYNRCWPGSQKGNPG